MRPGRLSLITAVLLVVSLLVPVGAHATDLRTGAWQVDGNGFTGILQITSVDGAGVLTGTIYGTDPITGYYNNVSNRIMFVRGFGSPLTIANIQVWEGVLVGPNPIPGAPVGSQLLSGTFVGFAGSGATVNRFNFGWAATSP